VAVVETTEKEKESVPTESKEQAPELNVTTIEPTTTAVSAEKAKTTVTDAAEEKVTPPIKETVYFSVPTLPMRCCYVIILD